MPLTLTNDEVDLIYAALDVSCDNIALDRLNDDEDVFADLEVQVEEARILLKNRMLESFQP